MVQVLFRNRPDRVHLQIVVIAAVHHRIVSMLCPIAGLTIHSLVDVCKPLVKDKTSGARKDYNVVLIR